MATQPLCGSLAFKARGIRRAKAGSDELSKPWMGAIKLILPRDCCHCVRTQDTPERQSSWSELCPAGAVPKQPHGTCGQPPSPLESSPLRANQPLLSSISRYALGASVVLPCENWPLTSGAHTLLRESDKRSWDENTKDRPLL